MGIETIIGAGLGLVGSAMQSDAAGDAADTQAAAADRASRLQKEMYDATVERNKPFVQGGTSAFNALLDRLGVSGNTSAAGYGSFGRIPTAQDVMQEPGYQFGLDEGRRALERQMNARGMNYSGAQLKAAQRYGNNYATTQYNNAFNRGQSAQQQAFNQLSNIANMGQNSANNTGQAGANYATQVGANMIDAGNAQAAAGLGQANIWANAINQGVSAYNRNRPPPISGDYGSMTTPDWTGTNGGFGWKGGTGGF